MRNLNRIGLNEAASEAISQKLNELLANYQVFYMNTRGFHWNIKGENFFELHQKFEELYADLQIKIDELAERVLTLGHVPLHSYTEYIKVSTIEEVVNVSSGKVAIREILAAYGILLPLQREILRNSGDSDDEGTNALISEYIGEQEKLVWMYSAYLGDTLEGEKESSQELAAVAG
ncbi:MAG: DNA starvation/stationary phase protection protein [Saprospiraceae bacterium]|nr:DNA starvation/stationary phase protection protein [Saprospiraceae bacterium]